MGAERRHHAALLAILGLGGVLRLWDLRRNGFGTEYYTAGVRSMLDSLPNLWFAAFDPAGWVSLDKPPVAFWIQAASAKLWGFDELAILVPQALEGLAAIALLHHLIARRFGAPTGLLAALILAVTPISVAVDRSSNTESALLLALLLAAWALVVATERGSTGRLALAAALVGVAFNIKMVAAFVVLPAFALTWWLGAPRPWPRRLGSLAVAGVVLAAVSLAWIVAFDLTPPDRRPYAGSTQGNSMLELAFHQYGVERLVGRAPDASSAPAPSPAAWYGARLVPPGPLRLLDPRLAGQVGWLLPLALGAVAAGLAWPRAIARPALALWGGWALTAAVLLSAGGGVFHTYYVVILAPPLAALAALGTVALWRAGGGLLALALLVTGAWQGWLQSGYLGLSDEPGGAARLLAVAARVPDDWRLLLFLGLVVGTVVAALGVARTRARPALAVGLAALLATPIAWAWSTVAGRADVWFPVADIALLTTDAAPTASPANRRTASSPASRRIADFVVANHAGERYALATLTSFQAAPIIILTGAPVIALGGYVGTDPIATPATLAVLVETGQLRFALLTPGLPGGRVAPPVRAYAAWIRANGRRVDPALWQREAAAWGELYDLRADGAPIRTAADAPTGR